MSIFDASNNGNALATCGDVGSAVRTTGVILTNHINGPHGGPYGTRLKRYEIPTTAASSCGQKPKAPINQRCRSVAASRLSLFSVVVSGKLPHRHEHNNCLE